MVLPNKIVYLTKNQTTYCKFCKRQFLLKWNTLNLNCTLNCLMQIIYHLYTKSTIPSKHKYIQTFPVKLHKNLN